MSLADAIGKWFSAGMDAEYAAGSLAAAWGCHRSETVLWARLHDWGRARAALREAEDRLLAAIGEPLDEEPA